MRIVLYLLSLILGIATLKTLLSAIAAFNRLPAGTPAEVQAESYGAFFGAAIMLFIAFWLFRKARSL